MNKNEFIILSGMFETVESSFLNTVSVHLKNKGFPVQNVDYFSDFCSDQRSNDVLQTISFDSILSNVNEKIKEIESRKNRVIIVGHSLGAFIGLIANNQKGINIFFDISLHPVDMFKSLVMSDHMFRWPGEDKCLPVHFVQSVKILPSIDNIIKNNTTKTYFIGALNGGYEISRKYHSNSSNLSELIKCNADHDFRNFEDWAATTTLDIILKNIIV